jgi:hypothetical protein
MKSYKNTFLAVCLTTLFSVTNTQASPWANPGDGSLRSDVEVLARYGLISGPVNNWPMSWKQITRNLHKADEMVLPSFVNVALMRVKEKIPNKVNVKAKAYYTNKVDFFRGFEDSSRGKAEIESGVEFNMDDTSVHINASYNDNEDFNLDGSYLSHEFGNWSTYVGSVERWWGPGRETTTLMSTNARPMASIGIRRVESKPFKSKWLSWLGEWSGEIFVSKMDQNRHIPKPIFVGMKLAFEPIKNFEVGLARTLMLCGQGRACGSKQWIQGFIGIGDLDNIGTEETQPGNQIAQIDLSYSFALNENLNVKLYAEGSAEDIIVVLPYTYSRIIGASLYGPLGFNGDQFRITSEYSDTTGSLAWLYGEHRKGVMYNHFIYHTGYRYNDRVLGHSLDSNSKYVSLNATLTKANGWEYSLKYQNILINSENDTKNHLSNFRERINSLSLNLKVQTKIGEIRLNSRIMDNEINTKFENKVNIGINTSWAITF